MSFYKFYDFEIPDYMGESIMLYINKGIIPGGFLRAVICNDLVEAVGNADSTNIRNLPAYAGFFYNCAPSNCWGNEDKMYAWAKIAGLEGNINNKSKEAKDVQ